MAAGDKALAIAADAGNRPVRQNKFLSTFGGIEILTNNAGVAAYAPIENFEFGDYGRMIAVEVTDVFVTTQEAIRHLKSGGRIIQIGSSMKRYAAFPSALVYKAGQRGYHRHQSHNRARSRLKGITVNTAHPAVTGTAMSPAYGPVAVIVGPGMAIGRHGQPTENASVVASHAGPDAAFVTGSDIVADGGPS
jgi:3-oxoacyl-[acyl-carrier protein] reductase